MAGGPGQPKDCARHRAPASKPVHSRARSVHPRARSVHKRARGLHRRARSSRLRVQLLSRSAWNSLGCLSNVTKEAVRFPLRQTLNAVLAKTWPHDGKCGAAFGHRSSGTRLRENTNDLGAAAHEEERTAAFGDAYKSDPVACCSVISPVVITAPTSAWSHSRHFGARR